MSSINNLTSGYLQSILSSTLQNAGVTQNSSNTSGISAPSVTLQSDNSNLSPFAQLMSTLQQLQQSDPSKYQQVTEQIASNLQSAAQTAQSQGNTTTANQLNQLSQDFTNASQSGQLPNVSDLAKAAGGHHHHHHFHGGSASSTSDSSTDSTSTSTSTSSTGDSLLSQLLSGTQPNTTQSNALNPMSIILNTLSQAGIKASNS
ncbi:MAG TPA: hypothetical protein VK335_20015 [Bryobacteraceae bacterium]|nr:hypothetical protein [Bryobacteraceae bacterium]